MWSKIAIWYQGWIKVCDFLQTDKEFLFQFEGIFKIDIPLYILPHILLPRYKNHQVFLSQQKIIGFVINIKKL